MTTPPPFPSSEALLRDCAWLTQLARGLLGDADDAEDAVQETLLAAMAHPPAGGTPGRPWLARVLRNRAVQAVRRSATRAGHEGRLRRESAGPSELDTAERLALQREVVGAVLDLREPYRSAIVLRYLDDLPPRRIARRLGVPVKTVDTRLERGRALLRERLDREHGGDRMAWAPGMLAVARAGGGGAAILIGATVMKTSTIAVGTMLTLAALGAGLIWLGTRDRGDPLEPGRVLAATDLAAVDAGEPPELVGDRGTASEAQRAPVEASAADTARPEPPTSLQGRVQDVEGRGVAGATVYFEGWSKSVPVRTEDGSRAISGPDGAFALPWNVERGAWGQLAAESPSHVTVLPQVLPAEGELVVVVAPRCDYAGRVTDELGAPLEDVHLRVSLDQALVRALRPGQERARERSWSANTDADGRFIRPGVGWTPGSTMQVTLDGFETQALELPQASRDDLLIVMRRVALGPRTIAGRVVDPAGEPAPGAQVSLGGPSTRADAAGDFVLEVEEGWDGGRLVAVMEGHLPGELEVTSAALDKPVEVRLGGPPLTIAGRVVDAAGEPVGGAQVWTRDSRGSVETVRSLPDGSTSSRFLPFEVVMAGSGLAQDAGRTRRTDDEGRFELQGLCAHGYRVFALHPRTMELVGIEAVEAGRQDVLLVLASVEPAFPVAGRVVARNGEPVAGAIVQPRRRPRALGDDVWVPYKARGSETTDDKGRFAFEALCTEGAFLTVFSADGGTTEFTLEGVRELEQLEIVVPSKCQLQVVLERDPDEATGLSILDAEGERMALYYTMGNAGVMSEAMTLVEGRSEVIHTDDRARTLVLLRDGEEVRRVPLQLVPGEVQVLRL